MAYKKSSTTDITLRIAMAMKQMGIDGLPRNYELVYEAYAGGNPDLVRDFIALGKFKTQAALDELGRKYLPHQHEASVLQRSAGAISNEMSNFMDLLSQERSSLNDYGRLIGEASQVIRDAGGTLGSSLEALQRATEARVTHTAEMAQKVAAQSAAVEGIQKEMADFEAMKFTDPVTKLGNRRAFNKALARVYANPELPVLCGVAVAEIDAERRFTPGQVEALSDHLVSFYGGLIRQAFPSSDLAVRFDGLRFGFLFNTSDEGEVTRLIDLLRATFQTMVLRDPRTGRNLGHLTLSAGVCMADRADSALDLASACERALAEAKGAGGDQVVVYGRGDEVPAGREWMLYRA
ncbi:diguanylate cyclase domain-containing protein [Shinella zoogloeoides]|jgi:diguanylate cyclase|uniref:diguanylate cyclase n=1 Tax=Shinella zoogloeoides TaxID=352475 RepID=A0A6N8TBD9_SHIZO|nr:diguanylate cyclase [Shinella zoogloeoides]MXN99764.1 diguanylate cyclase [Shinella zoogloeoides]UEX80743.1 diguanylate cyclase [Shinella zoogloeoides]